MSARFLASRSRQHEMMDAPDVDNAELDHAMAHLQIINRWLNGYKPSLEGVRQLLPAQGTGFSMLDVGCGSGDTLRYMAKWARRKGLKAELTGIELSQRSAERAAVACADFPEITIRHLDLFNMEQTDQYDIVHGALMLHHFSEDSEAVMVLRRMGESARLGVVINDLHRHRFAWGAIWLLTRVFSRSEILQNDAPLSVARGFTRMEMMELAGAAGFTDVRLQWRWAFRWLMVARRR